MRKSLQDRLDFLEDAIQRAWSAMPGDVGPAVEMSLMQLEAIRVQLRVLTDKCEEVLAPARRYLLDHGEETH